MSPTRKQIYEKVAEQKLTMAEAMELLKGITDPLPESSPQNATYTKTFSYDNDLLKDHKVLGEQILLGVVHCSLAIEAARARYPERTLRRIRKISFVDAIRINPPDSACVSVEINEKDDCVQFKDTYRMTDRSESFQTASGELVFQPDSADTDKKLDIQSIIHGEYPDASPDVFYRAQNIYGPSLFTLQKVYFYQEGAVGEVRLTPPMLSQGGDYAIHPALFDAGCQTALFSVPHEHFGKDPCVPIFIKEIQFYKDVPAHCYCHAKLVKKTNELIIVDIDYYDGGGTLVMRLEGMSAKRVSSAEALRGNRPEKKQQAEAVQEKANQNPGRAAIMAEAALSADLKRRIESHISEIIRSLLKSPVQYVDKKKNFMDIGVDSTQLIQVTKQLENEFGIELYPTLFFEYQNVEELAGYFSDKYSEVFSRHFGLQRASSSHRAEATGIEKMHPKVKATGGIREPPVIAMDAMVSGKEVDDNAVFSSRKENVSGQNDIAVIGMAGIFADSPDLEVFWENLREGNNLVGEIPADHFDYRPWFSTDPQKTDRIYCKWGSFINDVAFFDAGFFNITPKEAEAMDPQLRLLLQVLYSTAENAGQAATIRGTKSGMYVGICFHDYRDEMLRLGKQATPHAGTGNAATMMANRPSFYFNLKGPSLAVDTACSSSLVALHLACQALKNNECETAFVAGTNLLLGSWHYRYFCSIDALSHSGRCHTFDKKADGYVPGEGVGAVLLKPLQKAIENRDRIHAVIKGSAINHGGYTPSITAPSAKLESQVIIDAWSDARIDPRSIGYIEAHGTGTKLGDPIEIEAVKSAFNHYGIKDKTCAIGSAKAHIGHAEGAAGITGVIKAILSMKNREIPAMPMFTELNPFIRLEDSPLYINKETIKWRKGSMSPRRAGVNSFGFGGSYAHVVLEEYETPVVSRADGEEKGPYLVVLSAKNEDRLKTQAERMSAFLKKNDARERDDSTTPKAGLADIAYTLQIGREAMEERLAVIVSDYRELTEKLDLFCQGKATIGNLYRGNVRKERSGLLVDLINESAAGNEFLGTILQERQLNQLAQLWVSGADIKWKLLYGDELPGLVSAPTYPFSKIRHWFFDGGDKAVHERIQEQSAQAVVSPDKLLEKPAKKVVEVVTAVDAATFLDDKFLELTGIAAKALDRHAEFEEIGLDSIQSMNLVKAIESQFGVRMYVSELREHNTLHKLTGFLEHERKAAHEQLSVKAFAGANEGRKESSPGRGTMAHLDEQAGVFLASKFSEITGITAETLDRHAEFGELGLDSIQSMNLLKAIESQFALRMYVSELREQNTLHKLTEFIEQELEAGHGNSSVETTHRDEVISAGRSHETVAVAAPVAINAHEQAEAALSERPLVFVFSTPRSGSTLFRVMLMGHSEFFSPPELMLLPYRTMREWSEDLHKKNWDHFKDGFIESIKELERISSEEALERVDRFVKDELPIRKAYQMLQELSKGNYVIDKTPPYALEIETLHRAENIGKNPFYIHQYRNPISVMESLVRNRFDKMMGMKSDNPWVLGEQIWLSMNRNIIKFLSGIPKERQMRVCYEDLVQNPEIIMRGICARLNVKFEEAMLHPHQGDRMIHGLHRGISVSAGDPNFLDRKGVDPKLANTWQKHLDKAHLLTPETISLAEELGYRFDDVIRPAHGTAVLSLEQRGANSNRPGKENACELSLQQKSILKRMPNDPFWGIAQHHVLTTDNELDLERLEDSFRKLIKKHPMLRRYFIKEEKGWTQYEQETAFHPILVKDLTDVAEKDWKMHFGEIEREMLAGLRLDAAPLMRIAVAKLGKNSYELLVLVHMLLTDGITSGIVNAELLYYYQHPDKEVHEDRRYDAYVKDAANLEKSEVVDEHRRFWSKHVEGQPLVCPVDKEGGPDIVSSEAVSVFKNLVADFGVETGWKRDNFFYFHMIGLYRCLAKWAGNESPAVVFRLHRRNTGFEGDYSNTVGRFAGEVPLRMTLESGKSATEQAKLFQKLFREVPAAGLTYELLAYKGLLPPARKISPIVLNYQPFKVMSELPQEILDTLKVRQFESPDHTRFYQFDFIIRENADQLVTIIKYSKNQYHESTIENFMNAWRHETRAVLTEDAVKSAVPGTERVEDKNAQIVKSVL